MIVYVFTYGTLRGDEMGTVTTRNEERLSLTRRADQWKNSIIDETPNKLLEFVSSVQRMLTVKLDRIEHKISLRVPDKEPENQAQRVELAKSEIISSLAGLKTAVQQSEVPTTIGSALSNDKNKSL